MNHESFNQTVVVWRYISCSAVPVCFFLRISVFADIVDADCISAGGADMKKQKFISISADEYEHLKQAEDLSHRQRFEIRRLEKKLDYHKAFASRFLKRTLEILEGNGYSMAEIVLMYGDPKEDVLCREN